jgi:8-oxo-dGTP pyrophosphatase MutT (NUDIX family)
MHMTTTEPFAAGGVECANQIAALCWRMHKGHVQVLLITSRETGRWVVPKGWPMTGLSGAEAAAREAWEEAGVKGIVAPVAVGSFGYSKLTRPDVSLHCSVAVHPLRVKDLKRRYPEAKQRRRAWFAAHEAVHLVAEPELRQLFQAVDEKPEMLLGAA